LIAVQASAALDVVQALTGVPLADIKYYWVRPWGSGGRARLTCARRLLHR
jgi:hypothetical protein